MRPLIAKGGYTLAPKKGKGKAKGRAKGKGPAAPILPRSPVPPPSRPMDTEKYSREEEKRKVREEIEGREDK